MLVSVVWDSCDRGYLILDAKNLNCECEMRSAMIGDEGSVMFLHLGPLNKDYLFQ